MKACAGLGLVCTAAFCLFGCRTAPSPQLQARIDEGVEVIGIVHWGLNTYSDREWGFGDENPASLNPAAFDADQIVGACRAGGIQGLVIVAKHHDGFCLWPTKTTEHNISRSPFRGGKGDYVREMSEACRKAGVRFGVYCSPWDRNNAAYGTEEYVRLYHEQLRELNDGRYGDIFEMWFDGANGGDGWYGGAKGTRRIPNGYYRFDEAFEMIRSLQPGVCFFAGEHDTAEFRWPGNERGELGNDSRASICTVGGFADGKYGNPDYGKYINSGVPGGAFFKMCEADFPIRPGWFYHASERGKTKPSAYLMKCYLRSVGNGGIMNLGIAPNREGRLDEEDVKALAGFSAIKQAFFSEEVELPCGGGATFNVVDLSEDVTGGERVDGWKLLADGKEILSGKSIGVRRIRVLPKPIAAQSLELVTETTGFLAPKKTTVRCFSVDPALVALINASTTESGETDTAKWMTGAEKEAK